MFQLTEQTTHFTVISEKLEKEVREKAELSAQLLELKGQLRVCDREVTIVSWLCVSIVCDKCMCVRVCDGGVCLAMECYVWHSSAL